MLILPLKAGKDQGEERLLTQKRHTTKEVVTVRKNSLPSGPTVSFVVCLFVLVDSLLVYLPLDKGQDGKPPRTLGKGTHSSTYRKSLAEFVNGHGHALLPWKAFPKQQKPTLNVMALLYAPREFFFYYL